MNLMSNMAWGNQLEGYPGHYHQTLAPSPLATRRHTISGHLQPGINAFAASGSGLEPEEIHMSELSKRNQGHRRQSSSASHKLTCNVENNNNNSDVYHTHLCDGDGTEDGDIHAHRPLLTTRDFLRAEDDHDRASSYGKSMLEHLAVDHDCVKCCCERVTINVSGLKFETQLRTLNRLPHTLLGNPAKRQRFWDESRQEFFFDRHRPTFQAVLYYYQSGGRLKKPLEVPMDIFLNELHFYELGGSVIECFKQNEGYIIDQPEINIPEGKWQRKMFEILEYPESSCPAKIFALCSIVFILLSVVTFCVETLPQMKDSSCRNTTIFDQFGNATEVTRMNWKDPLFIVESVCIAFFVVELALRFMVSPSKLAFLKMSINWIDMIAIAPYFVILGINLSAGRCGGNNKGSVLSVLRVLRVVRILKLSKHSQGLKILGKTLKTSIRELSMFVLFLGIATVIYAGAIYYLEMGQSDTMFVSIPDAFWWAIITMTTVGYGDYVPVGLLGKVVGGLCVLSGVLAIALPVPVIVANFNNYYRHYTGRRVRIFK